MKEPGRRCSGQKWNRGKKELGLNEIEEEVDWE